MTAPHATQIVDGYVARLEAELADVPAARRRELVDDVRAHIAEARTAMTSESDADLLNILDRLGDPGIILLWASPAWNRRDKLIGTLVPPGGYFGVVSAASLGLAAARPSGPRMTAVDSTGVIRSAGAQGVDFFGLLGSVLFAVWLAVWLLSPILSGLYLAYRLRQHPIPPRRTA